MFEVICSLKDRLVGRPQTPLSRAARSGHKEVVKLLIQSGKVHVDSKSQSGRTPLSWAAEQGHKEIVKLLFRVERWMWIPRKLSMGQTNYHGLQEMNTRRSSSCSITLETKPLSMSYKIFFVAAFLAEIGVYLMRLIYLLERATQRKGRQRK
ncbi:hypothetical protein BDV19DRAFT_48924 [Aspergillus venezuelensis]